MRLLSEGVTNVTDIHALNPLTYMLRCSKKGVTIGANRVCQKRNTGWTWLIRNDSMASFSFELSGNSN